MTQETEPAAVAEETATAVEDDVLGTDWRTRTATILTTAGAVGMGVALGVKWAAVDTINTLGPGHSEIPELAQVYNHQMTVGLAVALVGLAGGVWLELRGRDDE